MGLLLNHYDLPEKLWTRRRAFAFVNQLGIRPKFLKQRENYHVY